MATSIQTVGNKYAILNDMDLLVFLGFLVEVMEEHPERYSNLTDLRSVWQECREASGPGTIDLALDRVMENPLRVAQFDHALSAVRERVAHFASEIPRNVLNRRYSLPGVSFNDFPVKRLHDVVDRLRALLDLKDCGSRAAFK